MNFTQIAQDIFQRVIADYHKTDNVDAPINNPYQNGTIEADM